MPEAAEIIIIVAANSAVYFFLGGIVGHRAAVESPDGRLARFMRWLDQPRRTK